ncbi:hypothetical protein OH492_08405 [Vibrio chagasii]|nr:hypothetical protein [Vibrio chagasii]
MFRKRRALLYWFRYSLMDSRVIAIGEPVRNQDPVGHNEKALLEAMIAWFSEFDPDIIIGWNVH